MDSPKNTHIDLTNLGLLVKIKMKVLEQTQEQITGIKHEIREVMRENKFKTFENDDADIHIKMTRNYTFDYGLFKMDNPDLVKRFFTTETITKIKDVYNKKELARECPEEYKKCLIELTPRLTIK